MDYKCGNCHDEHPTLQAVKDCFGLGQPVTTAQVQAAQAPAQVTPPTDKQVAFLAKLVAERPSQGITDAAAMAAALGKAKTSQLIDNLLKMPKETASAPVRIVNPGVPTGYYAIDSLTGNNDLDFFKVDCPTEGKWAGYTFVKRVVGGHPDLPVRKGEVHTVLRAILRAQVQEAALRYGKEIGQCCRCNRHLTDETSRAMGIGPECVKKGW